MSTPETCPDPSYLDGEAVYQPGDYAFHAEHCNCPGCDPPGAPRGVYGDEGGDYDADDIRDALRCGDFERADTFARW